MIHGLFLFTWHCIATQRYKNRGRLRAALLIYVNIMPDNATGTGREGVRVMVLKGGSMINAQRL